MKLHRLFLILLIFTSSLSICFGQANDEFIEGDNWVNQNGLYPNLFISFRYDHYSRKDLLKFREKLDGLKTAKFTDEWEGTYRNQVVEIGFSELRFDSNVGFIDFYIYTCFPELRYANYGKIIDTPEYIQFIPEFAADSPRKLKPVKFIKVKWDEIYYLVDESGLLEFSEKAAGIYVDSETDSVEEPQKWLKYWVKGNFEKELTGLPVFPSSYKSFQRSPIKARVIAVGKRTFEAEKTISRKYSERYYENVFVYPITIDVGRNKGVKKGMSFFSDQNADEIYISEVKENTAIGFVIRETDDNKNDVCYNAESSDPMPCPKLKNQLKVKTVGDDFIY